jgi:signal transduction histidine kinase
MNILSNAIDAIDDYNKERSPEDIKNHPSMIRIRTEVSNNENAIVRIIDNGSGMTEEVCHRLFEPFFTTKPVGQGTEGLLQKAKTHSHQYSEKYRELVCSSSIW